MHLTHKKHSGKHFSAWPLFVFLAVLVTGLLASLSYILFVKQANISKTEIIQGNQRYVKLAKQLIDSDLSNVSSGLRFISGHHELWRILNEEEYDDTGPLEDEFSLFIDNARVFDQARYIDETGMEIIRVSLRAEGGPIIVPSHKLQDTSNQYYFSETLNLDSGEIYISPFDLNIEHGKIEQPLKPVLRFGIPIDDEEGNRRGVVVLNYLGDLMLQELSRNSWTVTGDLHFLNPDGYWMMGPVEENEWGFMYDDKKGVSFASQNPEAWSKLNEEQSGNFVLDGNIYTFTTIHPHLEDAVVEQDWKLLTVLPSSALHEANDRFLATIIQISIPSLLLLLVSSWIIANYSRLRKESRRHIEKVNDLLKLTNKILRHEVMNDFTMIHHAYEMYEEEKKVSWLKGITQITKRGVDKIMKLKELENAFTKSSDLKPISVHNSVDSILNQFPGIDYAVTGDAEVMADEAIHFIFENLVRNAVVHGGTKKVRVVISKVGKSAIIRFVDYGKGIPDDIKPKLFMEGYKHGETGHTGLGLYIIKETVHRYGGTVSVEDTKPKGATFVIKLPLA